MFDTTGIPLGRQLQGIVHFFVLREGGKVHLEDPFCFLIPVQTGSKRD
jgi:hypothetical protein